MSRYDEHWKPMFLLCPPCHFKFDVIVKMETFDRWKKDNSGTAEIQSFLFQGHPVYFEPEVAGGRGVVEKEAFLHTKSGQPGERIWRRNWLSRFYDILNP